MLVFIHTDIHKEDAPQHHDCRTVRFPTPTDSTFEFVAAVVRALREAYSYRCAGVL